MRVAVVTESFLPQVNGVTNSVLQVIAHLHRRGHEGLVLAPGAGPDEVEGTPVIRVPALDLALVDSLPVGVPTPAVRATLEEFRPDVVHLASPFVLGARAITAARRLRVPTVAVYQTDVAGFAASYGVGLTARAAWRWTRRLHGRADRTLAPSAWAVDALREHGIPRVHRWGRGVDTARFRPASEHTDGGAAAATLRRELAPRGEMLVGYVGRLAHEKQVERLAALTGLPGVRTVIVGDGPARARLAELMPDAAFLGFRGGTELATAYAALDAFVHTGPFETFCQTVQEAKATGLPVMAPDAGGVRDLVEPGVTGWLFDAGPGGDDTAIRDRVRDWRDDPAARRRMGLAARASTTGRTWPAVCEELLEHYTELTADDSRGTHRVVTRGSAERRTGTVDTAA
ncbi:glycosyltransferase family 4 protein [Actinomycetospora termitidis]|uniref:Glycosyltransferase family 1 protein n=1 Tax=Actinomycetospora termitidis TaxID=3053470 RepID=A0ABT7MB39_9PSEU|nr:glycosyltransferase family 1 protein [Actinomycetospora sp. Odt1-22]MDL5157882.1 glycosyltransferase family 1 protein [Actinomycetospora sp. Odt1-22]